jgi:hypothetical protein
MAKLNLKSAKTWGWVVAIAITLAEAYLVYVHIANQSSVLGIINIQKKASYIYEGSYFWLSLIPISTIIFYWAFVKFIYDRMTTFKKVKPYTVILATMFMLTSLGLTALMVFSS